MAARARPWPALALIGLLALSVAHAADPGGWLASGNSYAAAQQYPAALSAYQQAADLTPDSAEAWYGVGWSYYHLAQYSLTVGPLRRALHLNPQNRDAAATLGEAYLELNDFPSAERVFRELWRSGQDFTAAFGLARALDYQQRYAEAQPFAARSVQMRPDLPRPRVLLGRLYREQGHLDQAESALTAAAALDPDFEPTLREQLGLYLLTRRPDLAQGPLYALLVRYPHEPALLEAQVTFCHQAGLTDRLPLALEQALAVLPPVAAVPYRRELAGLLLAQQNYADAEAQLRAALAAQPDDAASALLLGQALEGQDEAASAAEFLTDFSLRYPPSAALLAALAHAQLAAGSAPAALATAQRALALEPGSALALTVAEAAASDAGLPETALGYLRRRLAAAPGDATLRLRLAQRLADAGRSGEALQQYQTLRAGDSDLQALAQQGQLALASASGNAAYELHLERETPGGVPELAASLLEQGRYREADQLLATALHRVPDSPDLLALRAQGWRESGRGAESAPQVGPLLEAALARHPDDAGLNREQGLWLAAQGQPAAAVPFLENSLRADPLASPVYAALVDCVRHGADFDGVRAFLWALAEPPVEVGAPGVEGPTPDLALTYLARLWETRPASADVPPEVAAAQELRRLSDGLPDRAGLAEAAAAQSERARQFPEAAHYYGRAARDPARAPRALRLAVMSLSEADEGAALARTAATYLGQVAQDATALALAVEIANADQPPSPATRAALVGLVGAPPDSFEYHHYRLALFASLGRIPAALTDYDARAAADPSPASAVNLAQAQDLSGAAAEALATLERQPPDALAAPPVVAFHAQLLRELGRPELALDVLEAARGPLDPELSRLRAELLPTVHRPQEGVAEYARALGLGAEPGVCLQGMEQLWEAQAVSLESLLAALGQAYAALPDPSPVSLFVRQKLPAPDPAVQAWLEAHP